MKRIEHNNNKFFFFKVIIKLVFKNKKKEKTEGKNFRLTKLFRQDFSALNQRDELKINLKWENESE